MKQQLYLSQLRQGQSAVVMEISLQGQMRRRIYDLGLIPGTCVKRLQTAPAGSPIAYAVRGAVIALRRCDAQHIAAEVDAAWL